MMENMVLNWEKASATSEGKLTQILTQLVSVLELHGRCIVKLEANVASLTEQVTQQVGYIEGLNAQISGISERIDELNERVSEQDKLLDTLKIVIRPETDANSDMDDLKARVSALEQEETFNPETIADLVWEEIESKVDDAATQAADYAIDHMDAADVVRRGLKDIL